VAFDPAAPPATPPVFHDFQAIWDTGATNSVITQRVVDALALKPIGMTQVQGVHSNELSETYFVGIGLPNNVTRPHLTVTKGKLSVGSDVLVGMDIIAFGDFAVTNRGGLTVFSFCLPSHRDIDFVKEHNDEQSKIGRKGFRGYSPNINPLPGKKNKRR
jgi:hypothetical protein